MIGTLSLHANEVELSLTGTGRLSESVTGVANFGEITGAPVSEDIGQGQMVERLAQRQEASRHISGVWAPQVCWLHRPQPWFVTANSSGDVEGKEPKAHVGNGMWGGRGEVEQVGGGAQVEATGTPTWVQARPGKGGQGAVLAGHCLGREEAQT